MNQINDTRPADIAQPYRQAHPSPVHIRLCITEALFADAEDPDTPPVPFHVLRLIRDAIARACAEHDAEAAK